MDGQSQHTFIDMPFIWSVEENINRVKLHEVKIRLHEAVSALMGPSFSLFCSIVNVSGECFASIHDCWAKKSISKPVSVGIPVGVEITLLNGIVLKFSVYHPNVVARFSWPCRFCGLITRPAVCYLFCLRQCLRISLKFSKLVQLMVIGSQR